jgi:hypothetical protein
MLDVYRFVLALYLPAIAGMSLLCFVLATIGSVLFSLLLHWYIDRPIQRLRAYVKRHRLIPQKQPILAPSIDSWWTSGRATACGSALSSVSDCRYARALPHSIDLDGATPRQKTIVAWSVLLFGWVVRKLPRRNLRLLADGM